ncbi:chloride channel protein [Methylocapsa polymorpha]|uniref:Chloride channel protein n=1 Tax=Methylocapsa polymorpha TaxID=3080828 RepID=A0ABZ0HU69_9HYPH|nr:chloride channel protein [Methylocapsa sp. RX1]
MNDAFFASESLTFVAAAIALPVALGLLLLIFRLAVRRRLRVPASGGKDSPRLGVADAFDIDQRRRLVIIRRDNVEHLIMIGRSSDLAIESDAIGAEALDGEFRHDASEASTEAQLTPVDAFRRRSAASRRSARKKWLASARARLTLAVDSDLLPLALLSGVAGAGAGIICALFRLSLRQAAHLRAAMPLWWRDEPVVGLFLMIVGAAAAAAIAVWLVRRFMEYAAGSGIPHIEAVISGDLPPPSLMLLPVKFLGGLLAIGAGLALGREGPSVQMGATLAHALGKTFGRNTDDCARCWRRAQAQVSPPRSMRRSRDRPSCWRS